MAGRAGSVPSANDLSGNQSSRGTGVAPQASGLVAGVSPHHRRWERHWTPPRSGVRRAWRQKGTRRGGGVALRHLEVGAEGKGTLARREGEVVVGGAPTCCGCGNPRQRSGKSQATHSLHHLGLRSKSVSSFVDFSGTVLSVLAGPELLGSPGIGISLVIYPDQLPYLEYPPILPHDSLSKV